jgi:valyl-tRNA synthetase
MKQFTTTTPVTVTVTDAGNEQDALSGARHQLNLLRRLDQQGLLHMAVADDPTIKRTRWAFALLGHDRPELEARFESALSRCSA